MPDHIYRFGAFRLDIAERRLTRADELVPLRGKVFETLRVLVENHGHLVRKDELMQAVWPESVVEENNLDHNVSAIRKALGKPRAGEKYIETIPRQGSGNRERTRQLPGRTRRSTPAASDGV